VAKRANTPKSKLFGAVACLKTDVAEFSHPFDQSGQAWCNLRLSPLVVNKQWKKMFVHPLRRNMHVNKKPSSGGTPLATFESRIKVTLPAIATQ
jgi:hypothetical protein